MNIEANGIRLAVEDSGGAGEPVLLIMGLGGQLIHWPADFVQGLVDAGYRVLRFDNRDAGLSTHFSAHGAPRIPWIATQAWLGRRPRVPYTLSDMARDALGVLDALGIARAHVVGLSMGAMIAQRVTLLAPERVRSLTSIMGSSGARGLMRPRQSVLRVAAGKPSTADDAVLARYYVRFLKAVASPAFPPDDAALSDVFRRTALRQKPSTGATYRQLAAILADGERAALLARIQRPTLVVHGADDPWVPPACGRDTARRIPGARFALIPDMAHDLAPVAHPEIVRRTLGELLPFLQSTPDAAA
ncbi:alpha/beta fold hydrolase [Ottowia testudinis]|uniref:Alpha/beta fold hydrolase n=1 Tax=Ottowia testudinis TaxID=2816950 RepID=A0A975CHL6_9BURK|nr:alpha/beta fold hydrolase [Ottowia testudinis]QTD46583.1 alpha/beta fold hydrolase [Ottowia testudinis]